MTQKERNIEFLVNRLFFLKNQKDNIDSEYYSLKDEVEELFDKLKVNILKSSKHEISCYKKDIEIEYYIDKILENDKIEKNKVNQILKKTITVDNNNLEKLINLLKDHKIKYKDFKKFINVNYTVDNKRIKEMIDTDEISVKDLQGCYKATVIKSMTIK